MGKSSCVTLHDKESIVCSKSLEAVVVVVRHRIASAQDRR